MVEGTGFSLPIEGGDPAIGFYTTFFVAASSIRTAERAALERTRLEWRRRGMLNATGGVNPTVGVSEIERVPQRFRWRSGGGFSFYDKLEE